MRKSTRFLLIFLLIVPSLIICGCETTKGVVATGQGIVKDSVTAWQGVKNADAWMRKNLW